MTKATMPLPMIWTVRTTKKSNNEYHDQKENADGGTMPVSRGWAKTYGWVLYIP